MRPLTRLLTFTLLLCGLIPTFAQSPPGPAVPLTLSRSAGPVAVGELTGDGWPDLVFGLSGNQVSVMAGLGGGSFAAETVYDVPVEAAAIALADFNLDGAMDIAVCGWSAPGAVVLPGDGTGQFGDPITVDSGTNLLRIAAIDANLDGWPDLVVTGAWSPATATIYPNVTTPGGPPTFGAPVTVEPSAAVRDVTVADVDGDHRLDLVLALFNRVVVFRNITPAGNAVPVFGAESIVFEGLDCYAVAVDDFNADGRPDIAGANCAGSGVSVALNATTPVGSIAFTDGFLVSGGNYVKDVVAADLDGDGRVDLASLDYSSGGSVRIMRNDTSAGGAVPVFSDAGTMAVGNAPPRLAAADFDLDGVADLIVTDEALPTAFVIHNDALPSGIAGIQFAGQRNQASPFAVAPGALPVVNGQFTQGSRASDMTGPQEPFAGSIAYRTLSSPQPGAPPYASGSAAHAGLGALAATPQLDLRFDFSGATLAPDNIQDLRGEGPIDFADARLREIDRLVYFNSTRTTHNPSGHNTEKRSYIGGTFRILDGRGPVVLASGVIDYVTLLLDYDNFAHVGWAQVQVGEGTPLHRELVSRFGNPVLVLDFQSLQSPVFIDGPGGTPAIDQYAVFSTDFPATPNHAPTLDHPGARVSESGIRTTLTLIATDADRQPLRFTAVGLPEGLTIDAITGVITGTPTTVGNHDVTVTVTDGFAEALVSFTWEITSAPNTAPVLDVLGLSAFAEGTTVSHQIGATDADGDPLIFSAGGLPPGLTIDPDSGVVTGLLDYDSAGSYTVTFTVTDGTNAPVSATVTWTVTNTNRSPVAGPDQYDAMEDTPLIVGAPGVLGNDSDPDGETVSAVLLAPPTHGTLVWNDGGFTYTPDAEYAGTDSFTYTVSAGCASGGGAPGGSLDDPGTVAGAGGEGTLPGGLGGTPVGVGGGGDSGSTAGAPCTATGTVTIIITALNDAPVAGDDTATTDEDTPVSGDVSGNDSDVDDADLTFALADGPAHGAVTLQPDGTFTYTPAADYFGTDTFTYTVRDAGGASAVGTVTITVVAVDDPSVAVCYAGTAAPWVGATHQWTVNVDGTITLRTTLSRTFNDNTYGTGQVGWPGNNHTFKHLVGSDKVQIALFDTTGAKKLEFRLDYLSAVVGAPGGHKSLGVAGGDGGMVVGSAADILSADSSLAMNFRNGYVLTVDSPATDALYAPNPTYPNWIFDVWYEVTFRPEAFGAAGFGYPRVTDMHASPSKTGNNSEPLTVIACGQELPPPPATSDKDGKSGKGGKSDKDGKSGKGGKSDKDGKSGKGGKPDKDGKSDRDDKSDKDGKSDKGDESDKDDHMPTSGDDGGHHDGDGYKDNDHGGSAFKKSSSRSKSNSLAKK